MKTTSIAIIVSCLLLGTAAQAQFPAKSKDGKYLLNLDANGCMIQGYDCVAMFTLPDSTLKGNAAFESEYEGVKYWFVSAANKALFDGNPAKYAPLYGGFCGIAVAEGNLRPIQIWTHGITEGHLILNHNAKAKKLWLKNPKKNFKTAQEKWPVVSKKPAQYDILKKSETQESLSKTSFLGPEK